MRVGAFLSSKVENGGGGGGGGGSKLPYFSTSCKLTLRFRCLSLSRWTLLAAPSRTFASSPSSLVLSFSQERKIFVFRGIRRPKTYVLRSCDCARASDRDAWKPSLLALRLASAGYKIRNGAPDRAPLRTWGTLAERTAGSVATTPAAAATVATALEVERCAACSLDLTLQSVPIPSAVVVNTALNFRSLLCKRRKDGTEEVKQRENKKEERGEKVL